MSDKSKEPEKYPKTGSDEKCAVCLDPIGDKSGTDSCDHLFCWSCFQQWTQEHDYCPTCRQPVHEIRHNYRADGTYDSAPVVSRQERAINPFRLGLFLPQMGPNTRWRRVSGRRRTGDDNSSESQDSTDSTVTLTGEDPDHPNATHYRIFGPNSVQNISIASNDSGNGFTRSVQSTTFGWGEPGMGGIDDGQRGVAPELDQLFREDMSLFDEMRRLMDERLRNMRQSLDVNREDRYHQNRPLFPQRGKTLWGGPTNEFRSGYLSGAGNPDQLEPNRSQRMRDIHQELGRQRPRLPTIGSTNELSARGTPVRHFRSNQSYGPARDENRRNVWTQWRDPRQQDPSSDRPPNQWSDNWDDNESDEEQQ